MDTVIVPSEVKEPERTWTVWTLKSIPADLKKEITFRWLC